MSFLQSLRQPFRYTYSNAFLVIIIVNFAVYMAGQVFPSLVGYLMLNPFLVIYRKFYWQLFTYQFVHGGFMHLFSNMIGLFFFGSSVEKHIGSKEFTFAYLLSGTVCGIASCVIYVISGMWHVFLIGASGAVFAILLLYAAFFPRSVIFIWGILPVPAPILVIGYAALETFYMVFGMRTGVAHSTHLIGFAVAYVYSIVRFRINPFREWFSR